MSQHTMSWTVSLARLSVAAAVVAAAALTGGASASAQSVAQCAQRDAILTHLATKYSEAPVALGVTANGALLEVLSAKGGETWTILVTTPKGVSCLLATGEGWRPLQTALADPAA